MCPIILSHWANHPFSTHQFIDKNLLSVCYPAASTLLLRSYVETALRPAVAAVLYHYQISPLVSLKMKMLDLRFKAVKGLLNACSYVSSDRRFSLSDTCFPEFPHVR